LATKAYQQRRCYSPTHKQSAFLCRRRKGCPDNVEGDLYLASSCPGKFGQTPTVGSLFSFAPVKAGVSLLLLRFSISWSMTGQFMEIVSAFEAQALIKVFVVC
jgi:hypothetical protein